MSAAVKPVLALGLLAVLATGCAVAPGGGVGYGPASGAFDIGANYYEPFGGYYGGWGRSYDVAPFRYGDHRPFFGGGRFGHAWSAPHARVFIPSIPGGGRPGGFHGGGFHGGGEHGR